MPILHDGVPYGIPRYEWEAAVPYVRKCIFCYDRIAEGRQPACTEACRKKRPSSEIAINCLRKPMTGSARTRVNI